MVTFYEFQSLFNPFAADHHNDRGSVERCCHLIEFSLKKWLGMNWDEWCAEKGC
jgi:hypothetical protein